jgi:hypothetical protein
VFATEECGVLDVDHPIIRFWKWLLLKNNSMLSLKHTPTS